MKTGTRQIKTPHTTETRKCTYHKLTNVHKTETKLGLGTADRGARVGGDEGGPGFAPEDTENQ